MDSFASYPIFIIRWELKWQDFYYTIFACNKGFFIFFRKAAKYEGGIFMDSDPDAQTIIFQIFILVFLTMVNAFSQEQKWQSSPSTRTKSSVSPQKEIKSGFDSFFIGEFNQFSLDHSGSNYFCRIFPVHPPLPVFHRYWRHSLQASVFHIAKRFLL